MSVQKLLVPALLCSIIIWAPANASDPEKPQNALSYEVRDLGTLGGISSAARSLNDNGVVVGKSENLDGQTRAFIWKNGKMQEIDAEEAIDINNDEVVVGLNSVGTGYRRESFAFQWTEETGVNSSILPMVNAGLSPKKITGHARAINNQGDVAMIGQGIKTYAILKYKSGKAVDLGHLGGMVSLAYDVNDAGNVVGYTKPGSRSVTAFLFRNGSMIDLGNLGGMSGAHGINNKVEVVGSSQDERGQHKAFVWKNRKMSPLPSLGGNANARSINDSSVIVGNSQTNSGEALGCIWIDGEVHDLNEVIADRQGWTVVDAFKINNKGQIAGVARKNGIDHAVLLSPTR